MKRKAVTCSNDRGSPTASVRNILILVILYDKSAPALGAGDRMISFNSLEVDQRPRRIARLAGRERRLMNNVKSRVASRRNRDIIVLAQAHINRRCANCAGHEWIASLGLAKTPEN